LPFAGTCSFALYQENPCNFDTDEINTEIWAYSKILLLSQGIEANMRCRNCIIIEPVGNDDIAKSKYDYIFSFPPILGGREERNIANTFLNLAEKSLNDDGEIYCVLPLSFCFGREWFDFRKTLLKESNNMFSAVVMSLPALFQPYTSVSMVLLCLKKDGKGQICLMDASSEAFIATKDLAGWKQETLKPDSIIETILKQDEKYVWLGTAENLSEVLNLQPSRYLVNFSLPKVHNGEKLFKLEDLVSIVPLEREGNTITTDIPLIGMKELSASYLNCDINRKDIPVPNKKEYRILMTDSLLIGFIGGKFKVGRVHGISKNTPIALRHEVIAIQLKSNIVTEDYLLRCIMSEETELQARKMSTGAIISRLSQQDILSICIVVPKLLSQQENLCKDDTRSSLTESDRKLLESAESFRRDIHMKKHAIGQTIFNLNNWMKVLQRARRDGNGIVDDNAIVGTIHKTKVSDIYTNLQSIMQELQAKIAKLDSGYGMQSQDISLVDFIEEYIRKNQSPVFQYIFDSMAHRATQTILDEDGDVVLKEGDALEYINFPIEAMTIIFDNIINNACSHGFENAANPKNKVKIDILSEGENYIVTISNNGNPLATGYDSENVLTYGVSSKEGHGHYGIGGYEVRKLMREFNGEAELISCPNDEFCITYKLIFKNTSIVASF
jgi:histidine kinase-, DNA gyrase B-, and HSP90-like ATPase